MRPQTMSGAAPLGPNVDGSSRPAWSLAWFLPAYLLLAVWSTWPIARVLTTHLPLGSERAVTVPLMNAWTVWWNADRLRHGFASYWDAPIFYPDSDAFAFSEAQPTTLLVAPFVWLFDTPVAAYNLYLLLGLALNGWFGARLLLTVYGRLGPAVLGGALLEMLPFVHWQLGVLQNVPLWGVLWTLHALWRFSEAPRIRTAISAGVAFAVTYAGCNYHGLFLGLLLIPSAAFLLGSRLQEPRAWLRGVPGAAVAVLLLLPVVAVQLRVSREYQWITDRNLDLVRALSAEYGDYTATPWPQLLPLGDLAADNRRHVMPLSSGYAKYALAALGLVGAAFVRRHRRWTAFCVTLGLLAVMLSMGPKLRIGSFVPYLWLVDVVPGFTSVRSVFRASVFAQISVAFLAAGGLVVLARLAEAGVDRILSARGSPDAARGRWRRVASAVLVVGVGGCGVFEVYSPSPRAFRVPDVQQ
ncbi:MAG: hypothetical protein ABFS41_12470, partial [Myxococcota bacterium]